MLIGYMRVSQITHRVTVKTERRVVTELLEAVRGKTVNLFKVASAVTGAPDRSVREVIFPVVDERTIQALVKEALVTGSAPSRRVHRAVRASYDAYYRHEAEAPRRARLPLEQQRTQAAHRRAGEDPRGRE